MRAGWLLAAALPLAPAGAAAQLQIGAEVEGALHGGDIASHDQGLSVAGRLGYELPTPMFRIVPEVRVGYLDFGDRVEFPAAIPGVVDMWRVSGGGRIGVGEILRPSLFAHAGWGSLGIDIDESERAGDIEGELSGWNDSNEGAFTWDVGLALDLAVLPVVTFGVHLGYNQLATDDPVSWWSYGFQAAATF